MAGIIVHNVQVLDNPAKFSNPFQFEITFQCVTRLEHDLEWKVTYVGSANDDSYDQELDSVVVGPVEEGVLKFVFQAPAPDVSRIPAEDLLGVTIVLLTCSYKDNEFIRIGYYVNNEYDDETLRECPPEEPMKERINREILADKPRVTKLQIDWGDNPETVPDDRAEDGMGMEEDGVAMGMDDEDGMGGGAMDSMPQGETPMMAAMS